MSTAKQYFDALKDAFTNDKVKNEFSTVFLGKKNQKTFENSIKIDIIIPYLQHHSNEEFRKLVATNTNLIKFELYYKSYIQQFFDVNKATNGGGKVGDLAKTMGDNLKNAASKTGTGIASASRATGKALSKAANTTGTGIASASRATGKALSKAANTTGTGIASASRATGKALSKVATSTGIALSSTASATKNKITNAYIFTNQVDEKNFIDKTNTIKVDDVDNTITNIKQHMYPKAENGYDTLMDAMFPPSDNSNNNLRDSFKNVVTYDKILKYSDWGTFFDECIIPNMFIDVVLRSALDNFGENTILNLKQTIQNLLDSKTKLEKLKGGEETIIDPKRIPIVKRYLADFVDFVEKKLAYGGVAWNNSYINAIGDFVKELAKMNGNKLTYELEAVSEVSISVPNETLQKYANEILQTVWGKNQNTLGTSFTSEKLANAYGLLTDDDIKNAINKDNDGKVKDANDEEKRLITAKNFMGQFLTYLKNAPQQTFEDITEVKKQVEVYVRNLNSFRYSTKGELKLLLSEQIQGFVSARELVNQVTLADLIHINIRESRGIKDGDQEGKKAFDKFMDVLREFAKYVERNNISIPLTQQDPDTFETKKGKVLDDFIQYLYPLEGNAIPENTPFRKSPEDPLSRQKRIWMDMLRPYFEERILINEEVQKNPLARFEFDKTVRKLQLEKLAEENAMKTAALDINQIVAAIPPDTTEEGSKVIEDMVNAILRKRKVPVKLQPKSSATAETVAQKGGADDYGLALTNDYVASKLNKINETIQESKKNLESVTLDKSNENEIVTKILSDPELMQNKDLLKELSRYVAVASETGVQYSKEYEKTIEEINKRIETLGLDLETKTSLMAALESLDKNVKKLIPSSSNDNIKTIVINKITEILRGSPDDMKALITTASEFIKNVVTILDKGDETAIVLTALTNDKVTKKIKELNPQGVSAQEIRGIVEQEIASVNRTIDITELNKALNNDVVKAVLKQIIEQNDPFREVTPKALETTLLSSLYASQQAEAASKKGGVDKDLLDKLAKLSEGMMFLAAKPVQGNVNTFRNALNKIMETEKTDRGENDEMGGGAVIPADPTPDPPAGAAAQAAASDPLEKAKKNLVDLDNAKKEIRAVMDTLGGIRTKYNNTFRNLVSPQKVEEDQERFKKIQKENENKPEVDVSSEEQEIAAKYKSLEENGKAWIQELEKSATDVKDKMATVLEMITKIYATDPNNKRYIDDSLLVKMLFEGDYNATGDAKMGLMSHLGNVVGNIKTEYDNAERVYKPIAISVKERTDLQKERIKAKQVINYRGGDTASEAAGTSKALKDDSVIKELDYITNKLDELLKTKVQDLDTIYRRATNPVLATAVAEPSLFQILYNQYQDRRNKVGQFVAATELAKTMDANNLIPRKALAVTTLDKTVFVFLTLFIRLFSLSLTEWLIQKNWVRKMSWALSAFLGFYFMIFLVFAAVVNMDIYRMRLLFNYVNFHGNSGLVMTHLGMLVVFSAILFIIIANINIPIKGFNPSSISEEDKTSLMYRLEVLTMIIWLFLVILVVVL